MAGVDLEKPFKLKHMKKLLVFWYGLVAMAGCGRMVVAQTQHPAIQVKNYSKTDSALMVKTHRPSFLKRTIDWLRSSGSEEVKKPSVVMARQTLPPYLQWSQEGFMNRLDQQMAMDRMLHGCYFPYGFKISP
ncbi:MAG: hypothetical protein JWM92_158 [Candidatus Nomurabacteria bacterium]|nr:hypothetical protein [Candidatus Nomurabacteria bacterium]